jgi:DNA-binding NtrC family response regulator
MLLEIPVLITSGQPDIKEWNAFKKPYVAVIPKPFDTDELWRALHTCFAHIKTESQESDPQL